VHAQTIMPDQLTDSVLAAWRKLSDALGDPNPFFDPAFLRPAWEHLPEYEGGLLAVFDGATMAGAVPLVREARLRRRPVPGMVTGRGDYGFFGAPLVLPGRGRPVAEALLDAMRSDRTPWLRLDLLPAESEFTTSLRQVARERRLPLRALATNERAVVRHTAPAPALSSGSVRRFARKRRSLGRELGAAVEVVDRSDDPGALEDFLRLEASGWKGRAGGAFQVRPGHAEFLRQMWDGFRAQGRLRILSLQAEDRALAVRCCLVGGDALRLQDIVRR